MKLLDDDDDDDEDDDDDDDDGDNDEEEEEDLIGDWREFLFFSVLLLTMQSEINAPYVYPPYFMFIQIHYIYICI